MCKKLAIFAAFFAVLASSPAQSSIEDYFPFSDLSSPSTFAPANIIPVSSTYSLGPGDGLEINLYGSEQETKKGLISREGTFELPIIGTVSLSGLTFSEAKDLLKDKVSNELIGTSV
jgi:protein involved in polysaccharide export with SLBB domain